MNTSDNTNIYNSSQGAILRAGVVLPRKHPTNASLYYVSFGSKTASETGRVDAGVWCNNSINGFVRYRDSNNNPVSYGAYTPIQPYTPVNVLIAAGGVGFSSIIGFQPTNTSVPDIDNIDGLHVLGLTPNGSTIQMDDKTSAISLIYNKGASVVGLSDDLINLEVTKGATSGKEAHTGIFIRKGAIIFNLPDAQMQFDETGLSVSFSDGGTSMKITKKGVTFEGMETFKVASDEQVSIKGSKMTLEGTKDASLTASELKVGGKQLTNITGSQINIESMFGISLKSLAINFFALSKIQTFASMSDSTILGTDVRTATIIADQSASHNIVTGVNAHVAGMHATDGLIVQNMGVALATAPPTYAASKAAHIAVHAGLTAMGTAMLMKVLPITIANKILADTIAGTSEPAQEPTGNASGARDKNDTKSYGSVLCTRFQKNKAAMELYSVVPNIIAATSSAMRHPGSQLSGAASALQQVAKDIYPTNLSGPTSRISKITSSSGKSKRKG